MSGASNLGLLGLNSQSRLQLADFARGAGSRAGKPDDDRDAGRRTYSRPESGANENV